VLLPEKPELRSHLVRSFRRGRKALPQVGVFLLHGGQALVRKKIAWDAGRLEHLQPTLGGESTASEARQLLAEMPNELLELVERGNVICAV
jgi:hypothetical protein